METACPRASASPSLDHGCSYDGGLQELHGRPGGERTRHTYNLSGPGPARRNAFPADCSTAAASSALYLTK